MKKLLILLCSLLFLMGCQDNTIDLTQEEQQWLIEHPVVRFYPDIAFLPYESVEDGLHKGMVTEYLDIIEEYLEIEIQLVIKESWGQVLEALQTEENAFGFMTKTEDRSDYLNFTSPFVSIPNVILSNNMIEENITSENMGNYRITVVGSYGSQEFVQKDFPDSQIVIAEDIEDALMILSVGEADVFVSDIGIASYYIRKLSLNNIRYLEELPKTNEFRFGVSGEDEILRNILQKVINQISDNRHKRIHDKWIDIETELVSRQVLIYIGVGLLGILIILFIYILWNRSLKSIVNLRTKELVEKNDEILRMNQDLEKTVAIRTEEISAINEELRASLEDLQSSQDKLVEAEKHAALGKVITSVAHQMNTPLGNSLTAVSYSADLIEKLQNLKASNTLSSKAFDEILSKLRESADLSLSSLELQSKIVSRFKVLDASYAESSIRTVNLSNLISNCINLVWKDRIMEEQIDLRLDLDKSIEYETSTDWVLEIINNLMSNTLEHAFKTQEKKLLLMTLGSDSDYLILSFEDNGIGMEESVLERIYEPFYSLETKDIGLGMSIVYNIVKYNMRGDIIIESPKHAGTKVKIMFPIE